MRTFKVDLYLKDSTRLFPEFENLSDTKAKEIIYFLTHLMNLEGSLFESLTKKLSYKDFDEKYTFEIKQIFSEFNFPLDNEVYVIWSENDIDLFSTKDLINIWEDIWFSASDEAVILYSSKYAKNTIDYSLRKNLL